MFDSGYLGLFTASFLAATILPVVSEAVLAAMAASDGFDPWLLLAVASTGNTLGSCVNWALGRYCLHWQDRRWFPIKPDTLDGAQKWFNRWGVWSLLLAWTPFLGDPLTFIAGVMKVRFGVFFVLVAISKTGRYLVVLGLVEGVQGFF